MPSRTDAEPLGETTTTPLRRVGVRERLRRADRVVLAAVVVGAVLRIGWALHATGEPIRLSDPWRYQQMAIELANGSTPTSAGEHTTLFPIGYPLVLAPFAWIVDHVGAGTLPAAAAAVNVAAAIATIWLGAALARRWFGPPSGRIAAWLLALAVPHIVWAPVAFSEPVFGAVVLGVLLLATRSVDESWRGWRLIGLGCLVGFAILVRSPGVALLLAAPMAYRGRTGTWRGAARPALVVAAGAVLAIAPWTVRNAVQVGVATPLSTNNAAFLCIGNRPGADGGSTGSLEESERCWRGSPLDHAELFEPGEVPDGWVHRPVAESTWYRQTTSEATAWIREHPEEQPHLVWRRLVLIFHSSANSLSDAEGFGATRLVEPPWRGLLLAAATGWLWLVLAVSALGLAGARRCRRAVVLWGTALVLLAGALVGIGLQRYQHPVSAVLAVVAAGAIGAALERATPSEIADS